MKIDNGIKMKVDELKEVVHNFLPSPDQLSEQECREILQRYVAAIQGNFVNWMAGATVSARSLQSRFAAEENIYVEIRDNHPEMLRNFAIATSAEPTLEHFHFVLPEVNMVNAMVSEMSGAKSIMLMAILENTSAVFIPFLAAIAKKLGSNELIYTDVHGEADIDHANQFLWALSYEKNHYPDSDMQMQLACNTSLQLLKKIFAV